MRQTNKTRFLQRYLTKNRNVSSLKRYVWGVRGYNIHVNKLSYKDKSSGFCKLYVHFRQKNHKIVPKTWNFIKIACY